MIDLLRWAVLSLCFFSTLAELPGWKLLFGTTVLDEPSQSPLTFDKPLPKWLRGSLVSEYTTNFFFKYIF